MNFSHISDPLSRQILVEGYQAVTRLGLEELFYQPITEDSYNDPRFALLNKDIFIHGGSDHSGASFSWMCVNLQAAFTGRFMVESTFNR